MSLRFQRLLLILVSLILLSGSLILILNNSKKNIIFFYTPSELLNSDEKINKKIRIGGFVKENSIIEVNSKNNFTFIITDNKNDIFIEYKGILPDLFKDKQGAVVEGILIEKSKIMAERVFAKHDENYIPASIKKQLKDVDYWKKEY